MWCYWSSSELLFRRGSAGLLGLDGGHSGALLAVLSGTALYAYGEPCEYIDFWLILFILNIS